MKSQEASLYLHKTQTAEDLLPIGSLLTSFIHKVFFTHHQTATRHKVLIQRHAAMSQTFLIIIEHGF